MTTRINETETVVKRIIPYLQRRGYDVDADLHFEVLAKNRDRYEAGYVDILVWTDKTEGKKRTPDFIIEAKRIARALTAKDKKQALDYANDENLKVPFVAVCNGADIRCFNKVTGQPIKWNGRLAAKLPAKSQLKHVLSQFKANPELDDVELRGEDGRPTGTSSLPYRPGLPLRQLNALFSRCHDAIRKHEKDEGHIFDDFSKLLFLKLLEEKADIVPEFQLPYSYLFHEMAAYPDGRADQVESAVKDMIEKIKRNTAYGEVLADPLNLRNARTFHFIVKQLAAVSFNDSAMDSKGAAFEFFVRATLKGKKLGQYFTPRPLVKVMAAMIGSERIINALLSGDAQKVLDPACGTGGFLVYLLNECLRLAEEKLAQRKITKRTYDDLVIRLRGDVFFGSDANEGVACAAKMNMIVAGDGHSNIKHENSLARKARNWSADSPDCDYILTNPPFGTSEEGALEQSDLDQFDIATPKGQWLFLQKMVLSTVEGGEICTVIDEGVLNTDSAAGLRRWIMDRCKLLAVVRLPDETFKPNKINVRSSLLHLQRKTKEELQFGQDITHNVVFVGLKSLGMDGAGDPIRGFNFKQLLEDVEQRWFVHAHQPGLVGAGTAWDAFSVATSEILDPEINPTCRIDLKYWEPATRNTIAQLGLTGRTIKELNTIKTSRGNSPTADSYVDEVDGYALVIKAGSNISKFGELIIGGDFIEKSLYDEFVSKAELAGENLNLVQDGDVLLSSTGDGTLGKCCVYRQVDGRPVAAIAEGHVTIIRPDPAVIYPEYLCDYLRVGFGAAQIERLYTGSTGMIELTPSALDTLFVNLLSGVQEQEQVSRLLRAGEAQARSQTRSADEHLSSTLATFRGATEATSARKRPRKRTQAGL